MTVDEFRQRYPAFADSSAYPDSQIQIYLDLADAFINKRRWPTAVAAHARGLFVAHHLTMFLGKGIQGAANAGALGPGVAQSKTVHDVSVSYDNTLASYDQAGHWNLTRYGLDWYQLSRMVGAGPVQLPGCVPAPGTLMGGYY